MIKLDEREITGESKWLRIEWMEYSPSGKTSKYSIYNKVFGVYIGEIKFNPGWRKYLFYPYEGTHHDKQCLEAIVGFIDLLMENRKRHRSEEIVGGVKEAKK